MSVADRWILSRIEHATNAVQHNMKIYRFDLVSQTLHEFFWNEYCDWYVELSKPVIWDEEDNPEQAQASRFVLISVLEKSLKLLHPFMPFISEEIWQRVAPLLNIAGDSIMVQPYPTYTEDNISIEAEADIDWIKGVVIAIRNIRGEMDISPAKAIDVLLHKGGDADKTCLDNYRQYLQKLTKLNSIQWLAADQTPPAAATQLYKELEILVPLAGLIDADVEQARLQKEIAKLETGLNVVSKKLNNQKFIANAPEAVVNKERGKEAEMSGALAALQEKLIQIKNL
jgi:valyl-tRNA synthetase